MELVEGVVSIGGERFPDVEAFVEWLDDVGTDHEVTVQAFDARYVVSRGHLELALELADRERERGEAIVRGRSVEILLYAAGRRQIDHAMQMGVDDGETPTVVLVDGTGDESAAADSVREAIEEAETLGEYDEALVREFFDVTDTELSATNADLEALVCERVALLVVER